MRKWKWIDHTLRREPHNIGDPWSGIQGDLVNHAISGGEKETVEKETKTTGKSWKQIKTLACCREGWKEFVDALCF